MYEADPRNADEAGTLTKERAADHPVRGDFDLDSDPDFDLDLDLDLDLDFDLDFDFDFDFDLDLDLDLDFDFDWALRSGRMKRAPRYPTAVDPKRVGKYPALAGAGGGYVWDEVLEYRVWCQVAGEDDHYYAFPTYPKALAFSRRTTGADEPIVLIRQREYISEPEPGRFIHIKKPRNTEWPVEFLSRPRRKPSTLPDFFASGAPTNRVDILRGLA